MSDTEEAPELLPNLSLQKKQNKVAFHHLCLCMWSLLFSRYRATLPSLISHLLSRTKSCQRTFFFPKQPLDNHLFCAHTKRNENHQIPSFFRFALFYFYFSCSLYLVMHSIFHILSTVAPEFAASLSLCCMYFRLRFHFLWPLLYPATATGGCQIASLDFIGFKKDHIHHFKFGKVCKVCSKALI